MKKIRIIALLLTILCVMCLTACGGGSAAPGESRWTMNIEGNKVTLPCTMADLEAMDIHLYTEYDENMIYASQNESFTLICAVHGDSSDLLYLAIDTGDKPEDGPANATVIAITNMMLPVESFNMQGSFGLGASIDDMAKAFGDDYTVPGATKEDIRAGFTVINYRVGTDNVIFNFNEDELVSIEVQYIEGE